MKIVVLCVAFLIALASGHGDGGRRSVIASQHRIHPEWNLLRISSEDETIEISFMLKQKNLNVLHERFTAVSDPKNADWGKFLTMEEIASIVRPDESVFQAFRQWLSPFASQMTIQERADSIKVTTDVRTASSLFHTIFRTYENIKTKQIVHRIHGSASVPSSIAQHLDFVAGLSEFFSSPVRVARYGSTKNVRKPQDDIIVTPGLLRRYYNVPSSLKGKNSNNHQAIAAFDDYYSMGALKQFAADQGYKLPPLNRVGPDCFPNCDQYESDLDIQYVTAMGMGVPTDFITLPQNYWILQWTEEVLANYVTPLPHVFSVSYGWSELEECDIAIALCPNFGYDSKLYVNRANQNFVKMGSLGISVLVSDGDDGAASLGGASGNCPLDTNVYCPTGGCQHSSSSCNSFTVINKTSGEHCFFPGGIGSLNCSGFLNDPGNQNALGEFFNANSNCNLNIEQDNGQLPHFYSSCSCDQIQYVDTQNYTFQQYQFDPNYGMPFTADYPTSSPYVTSVGATQFIGSGSNVQQEVVCSILNGATITTGGGFSSFQPQMDYQTQAVQKYFQSGAPMPPSNVYNKQMRAYPDISFVGHNYKIFVATETSDTCPCQATGVDGTSASSPALAGLISLINDQLISNGKSPLGFLNPLLYQMSAEDPSAFNDITEGDNKCSRAYCCQWGWSASQGWDPVTGLGSPNFKNMLSYVLQKKGVL